MLSLVEITAFRLDINFPPMALEFIRDHVNFKLPYNFSYEMKTLKITTLAILSEVDLSFCAFTQIVTSFISSQL